ncbi:MAG: non-homologous end-joining DNA ligase [Candidatus Babeliales bacterium]
MNKFLKALSADLKKKLKKKKMPSFEKPMLATLTKDYFSDKEWIYERKFDGQRCLIFKNYDHISLKSRNNNSLNATYPELVVAAKKLKADQLIIDGEVVAFKGKVTSFEKLQQRLGVKSEHKALSKNIHIYIYIFDILYLDGYELLKVPLHVRKSILKAAITYKDPIRYTIHKNTKGKEFFNIACKKNWEGIIAKERNSTYVHARSPNWLKFKCVANQELVIGGYTDPAGSRVGFGALLLGYYKKGKFIFAGKVGTGFSDTLLRQLSARLKKIEIKKNPFHSDEMEGRNVHFVKPILVAEIGFEEWTKDNKLRQPRFLGLRTDKDAKKVVQEKA